MSISDQAREAFHRSGLGVGEVGRGTGTKKAVLGRFRQSQRELQLDSFDKLCALLKLNIMTESMQIPPIPRSAKKSGGW